MLEVDFVDPSDPLAPISVGQTEAAINGHVGQSREVMTLNNYSCSADVCLEGKLDKQAARLEPRLEHTS
jgi:hypothetical protein